MSCLHYVSSLAQPHLKKLPRMILSQNCLLSYWPLYTLGASSGAWRLACFGQAAPLSAYSRLEALYIGQKYETKPTPTQVSTQVKGIISGVLGQSGAEALVSNSVINTHLLACRGRHLNRISGRFPLGLGLAATAASNLISRRSLGFHLSANSRVSCFFTIG